MENPKGYKFYVKNAALATLITDTIVKDSGFLGNINTTWGRSIGICIYLDSFDVINIGAFSDGSTVHESDDYVKVDLVDTFMDIATRYVKNNQQTTEHIELSGGRIVRIIRKGGKVIKFDNLPSTLSADDAHLFFKSYVKAL